MINDNAARIVERHLAFREGIAYGIDHLLEPPGLGAHCDMLENRTTYVSAGPLRLDPSRSQPANLPLPPFPLCLRGAVDRAEGFRLAPSGTRTR